MPGTWHDRHTWPVESIWWPLTRLRLRTAGLELRLPSQSDLDALATLAAAGVHDDAVQPFAVPWTDADPPDRARGTLQYHWSKWAAWKPAAWSLDLVVVRDGTVVGTQGIGAKDFAIVREVSSGSWLGRAFHGQGMGTEMRAAILHLAFAGLGAQYALSSAFSDNPASRAVSRKLGYEPDGISRQVRRGQPATEVRFRLSRETWAARRRVPVTIEGLEECLPMFGLPGSG